MRAIDLVKISREVLKNLSKVGVNTSDCDYIEMYDEYEDLIRQGYKKEYVRAVLSEKYKTSESTIYRVVSRFEKHIKI